MSSSAAPKRKREEGTPPTEIIKSSIQAADKVHSAQKQGEASKDGDRATHKKSSRDSVTPPPRSPPRQRKRPGAASGVPNAYRDRRPPRPDERSRPDMRDPPSPPPRSPPRQRKRPNAGAGISYAQREEARQRQMEREKRERELAQPPSRDVSDFVKQHYNSVPERGREWRRTDSKIKGLRSYNNWVKSVLIQKCMPSQNGARVLDIGCGKGGDLMKWQSQHIELYVGLDPADVSIQQARDRYKQMQRKSRNLFHGEFIVRDCFGKSLAGVPIIDQVGFDRRNADPRWGGGGFDIVSMMFCMHYAFESEEKARIMLSNVAGALKKGGRFLGVIPNSDVISAKVEEHHKQHTKGTVQDQGNVADDDDDWDPEKTLDVKEKTPEADKEPEEISWGNSIYQVKFPGKTPKDGIFRPPFGWKYFYFLEEAVEQVPEYVVPWEAFRG